MTTFCRARALWTVLGCMALCASAGGATYARGQLIPELRLKNGVMLHAVTVVAVGSTTVVASGTAGRVRSF
jgi:hypothetical protein